MSETVQFYLLWLSQILQIGIYGITFATILTPRWKAPRWLLDLILMAAVVLPNYLKVTTSIHSPLYFLSLILANALMILYVLFCFEDSLLKKALISVTVWPLGFICDVIILFFHDFAKYLGADAVMLPSAWQISFEGCLILTIVSGCFLFIYFRFVKNIPFHISKLSFLLILPIGQVICYYLTDLKGSRSFYQNQLMIFVMLFSVIGNTIIFYYVIINQMQHNQTMYRYTELLKLWDIEKQNYDIFERRSHELDKIRHDFNNQINTAARMAAVEKDYSGAGLVFNSLRDSVSQAAGDKDRYCFNPLINAVIADKAKECSSNKILLETNLEIGEIKQISLLHQCSLFSNLMDNAIHAASSFPGERYIRISASIQGAYLIIKVSNSSQNPSKKEAMRKGFGIEIITDIVNTYQGYYSGKWKDDEYKAIVSIMLKP